jgi:hypothetical protein
MARDKDDLWRNFPKTAIEFERRFATEEACRAYWVEARWGGEPACARCGSKRVWAERGGFLFEWAVMHSRLSIGSVHRMYLTNGLTGQYAIRVLDKRFKDAVIRCDDKPVSGYTHYFCFAGTFDVAGQVAAMTQYVLDAAMGNLD